MSELLGTVDAEEREHQIVRVLLNAFAPLMDADPEAFRTRFRKMAADPWAFYRGSAPLFYADVRTLDDPWANERTSRVWIQGDLHAENFGTYMDGEGTLVFDVNDFDEAFLGHFTWDVWRFAASLALMGWQKAIPDEVITDLVGTYVHAYLDQVHHFVEHDEDHRFSLRLDTTDGAIREVLLRARLLTRVGLLDSETVVDGYERRFRHKPGVRGLPDDERERVLEAFRFYLGTIPKGKRFHGVTYRVKDVVGRSGFGIGSAGLPAYSVLIEGRTQALENDLILSMKQGNVAAPSRVVDDPRAHGYFHHHGHRTAVSQRALQAHADPLLGHTDLDGTGFVVSEVSPYEVDLEWDEVTEPDEIRPVVDFLGRATAKIHCVSDEDSPQDLVNFQTEDAIAEAVADPDEFARAAGDFALAYSARVRSDHARFVDAFRAGRIEVVPPT